MATDGHESAGGSAWEPTPSPPPLARSAFGQFRADLAAHPAWFLVPLLATLAAAVALLLMARGDLHVPAIYRLF
ncbi:MAG: hypothetical protein FJ293_12170 [Planctomycetes bacterium]|nr:hypothetical protein [Planctomycetota bacterium]